MHLLCAKYIATKLCVCAAVRSGTHFTVPHNSIQGTPRPLLTISESNPFMHMHAHAQMGLGKTVQALALLAAMHCEVRHHCSLCQLCAAV